MVENSTREVAGWGLRLMSEPRPQEARVNGVLGYVPDKFVLCKARDTEFNIENFAWVYQKAH